MQGKVKETWSAYALLGILLCLLPPTRSLGYESAWAVVLATSIAGVFFLRGLGALGIGVALSLPVFLLALNALVVKTCEPFGSFAWYVCLVPAHALFATALLKRVGTAAYLLALLVSLGLMIAGPLGGPSLRAYSLLLGFFAGSLYDETLPIPHALWWHSLMVLLFGVALWRRRVLPALAASGIFLCGHSLGFTVDRSELHAALARTVATDHLLLHFAEDGAVARRIAEIWPEAERSATEIAAALGDDPRLLQEPVQVYLYEDADSKERLMGAKETLFTRAFVPEVHVLFAGSDQIPALAHELVHAMARVWTRAPLGLPARLGFLIDLGLTEGLAVALARDQPGLDTAMAALKAAGHMPALTRIFGTTGFYQDSASRAYTAAGAFIAWLLRTDGPALLHAAYARGSLAAVIDLPARAQAYETYLDTVPLDGSMSRALAENFKEKPLYARVCARDIAARKVRASKAVDAQRYAEAQAIYSSIARDDPGDTSIPLAKLELEKRKTWAGLSDGSAYEEALRQLLAMPEPVQKARLQEQLADRCLARGDSAAADALLASAQGQVFADEDARRLAIKRKLIGRSDAAEVFSTLNGSLPEPRAMTLLAAAFHHTPRSAEVNYLLARRWWNNGDIARAVPHLQAAIDFGTLPRVVQQEALRLRLDAFVRLRARASFAAAENALVAAAKTPSEKESAARAADKARFYLRHETW